MEYNSLIIKSITFSYPQIFKIVYLNRIPWSLRLSFFSIFLLVYSIQIHPCSPIFGTHKSSHEYELDSHFENYDIELKKYLKNE